VKVGFFHASAGPATVHVDLARVLIKSVRRAMPGVPIVHLTDTNTPAIDGVDGVFRGSPGPLALSVLQMYAEAHGAADPEWLFVDTDVVVQRDIRHVFDDRTFAVAVATREGTYKPSEVGTKFMSRMPYNKGVVFSRSRDFWLDTVALLRESSEQQQSWMGDQRSMNDVIAAGDYCVKVLEASYNYPPKFIGQDVRQQHILHFKGPRKAWMGRQDWP